MDDHQNNLNDAEIAAWRRYGDDPVTAEELDGVLAEAERHMDRLECEELRYLDRMADEQTIKVLKAELARREWLTKGANGV